MNITAIKIGNRITVHTSESPSATKETKWTNIPQDPHPDFLKLLDDARSHLVRRCLGGNQTVLPEAVVKHMAKVGSGYNLDKVGLESTNQDEFIILEGSDETRGSFKFKIGLHEAIYPQCAELETIWESLQEEAILYITGQKYDIETSEKGQPSLFEEKTVVASAMAE